MPVSHTMNFEIVLDSIVTEFNKEKIRYALIGGFAMGALGIPRSTIDVDFLVAQKDLVGADAVMTALGYKRVHRTENVSQYISPLKIFGEVDFLHAFRNISLKMLDRATDEKIFKGKLKVKVLRAEDIIGLKLQAMANDPERSAREYADIESLARHSCRELDWDLLEEYFSLFNLNEEFERIGKYRK